MLMCNKDKKYEVLRQVAIIPSNSASNADTFYEQVLEPQILAQANRWRLFQIPPHAPSLFPNYAFGSICHATPPPRPPLQPNAQQSQHKVSIRNIFGQSITLLAKSLSPHLSHRTTWLPTLPC